ncbi:MAG: ExbD/TolR family protein [Candidatus Schekmanbacteria bacterium]|nr:ExbD/TolR family protein [Candidatus Schekmanbacteria bacterium]
MGASVADTSAGPRSPLAEINVTPLVDVMLVMLIIFMITAPMMHQGLNVDLPPSESGAVEDTPEEPVTVSVDKEGRIHVDEAVVPIADLVRHLQLLPDLVKRTVHIEADKAVPYGDVVRVLDGIKQAGVEKLAIITVPEERRR